MRPSRTSGSPPSSAGTGDHTQAQPGARPASSSAVTPGCLLLGRAQFVFAPNSRAARATSPNGWPRRGGQVATATASPSEVSDHGPSRPTPRLGHPPSSRANLVPGTVGGPLGVAERARRSRTGAGSGTGHTPSSTGIRLGLHRHRGPGRYRSAPGRGPGRVVAGQHAVGVQFGPDVLEQRPLAVARGEHLRGGGVASPKCGRPACSRSTGSMARQLHLAPRAHTHTHTHTVRGTSD